MFEQGAFDVIYVTIRLRSIKSATISHNRSIDRWKTGWTVRHWASNCRKVMCSLWNEFEMIRSSLERKRTKPTMIDIIIIIIIMIGEWIKLIEIRSTESDEKKRREKTERMEQVRSLKNHSQATAIACEKTIHAGRWRRKRCEENGGQASTAKLTG